MLKKGPKSRKNDYIIFSSAQTKSLAQLVRNKDILNKGVNIMRDIPKNL